MAKKRVINLYMYKNEELLLFCNASIKGKSSNVFAALDNKGITLYEYNDTYESKLMQLETHQWREWDQVLIDHYFIKSTFQFTSNNTSWSVTIHTKRKEAQQIITSIPNINVEVAPRPLYRKILDSVRGKHGK